MIDTNIYGGTERGTEHRCKALKIFNLQATKLFIVISATKGGWLPLRFSVRLKVLYRVIQPLIPHCLLRKMVYLNTIYVIATRNYEFLLPALFRN